MNGYIGQIGFQSRIEQDSVTWTKKLPFLSTMRKYLKSNKGKLAIQNMRARISPGPS